MTQPPLQPTSTPAPDLPPPSPATRRRVSTPRWLGLVTITLVVLAIGGLIWGWVYAIKTRDALDAAVVRIQKSENDIVTLRQDLRALGEDLNSQLDSIRATRDTDVNSITGDIDAMSQCINTFMDTVAHDSGYGYTYYYCDGARNLIFGD